MRLFDERRRAILMSNNFRGYARTVSGNPVTLADCMNDYPVSVSVSGNTVQDGTPTPEAPIEMYSCGDRTGNLYDVNAYTSGGTYGLSYGEDDYYTWYKDNSAGTNAVYPSFYMDFSEEITPDTKYLIVTEVAEIEGEGVYFILTDDYYANCQFNKWAPFKTTGVNLVTVTSKSSFDETIKYFTKPTLTVPAGSIGKIKFRISVLPYDETITADNFVYEPFGYKVPVKVLGKNLYNVNNQTATFKGTVDKNDWITCERDNSNGSATAYINLFTQKSSKLKPDTSYVIVAEIKEISGATLNPTTLYTSSVGQFNSTTSCKTTGTHLFVRSTIADFSSASTMLRSQMAVPAGSIGKIVFRISVLPYDESLTPETFVYEPYHEPQSFNIYTKEPINGNTSVADVIKLDVDKQKTTLTKKFSNFIVDSDTAGIWCTNQYCALGKNVCNFRIKYDSPVFADGVPKPGAAIVCSHFTAKLKSPWVTSGNANTMTPRMYAISDNTGIDFCIRYDTIGFPLYEAVEALPEEATDGQLARVNVNDEYLWYVYSENTATWTESDYVTGVAADKTFRTAMETAFTNWLANGNAFEVCYELPEYTDTDISSMQNWNSIPKLNRGTNIITAETEVEPSAIEVNYYADKTGA